MGVKTGRASPGERLLMKWHNLPHVKWVRISSSYREKAEDIDKVVRKALIAAKVIKQVTNKPIKPILNQI